MHDFRFSATVRRIVQLPVTVPVTITYLATGRACYALADLMIGRTTTPLHAMLTEFGGLFQSIGNDVFNDQIGIRDAVFGDETMHERAFEIALTAVERQMENIGRGYPDLGDVQKEIDEAFDSGNYRVIVGNAEAMLFRNNGSSPAGAGDDDPDPMTMTVAGVSKDNDDDENYW